MQSEVDNFVYYLILALVTIYFSFKVGNYAKSKGRSFWLNFTASIVISPIPVFIALKFSKFKKFSNRVDEIKEDIKKWIVLIVLFFLPVTFLLFLYPSKHNYETLDVIKHDIPELKGFTTIDNDSVVFEGKISIVAFLGSNPMYDATLALNLKELIYDKFLGFKNFQVLALVPNSAKDQTQELSKELNAYVPMEYWKFAFGSNDNIIKLYSSLKISKPLKSNLSSSSIFIIDKERSQRGRLDDRTKKEIETNFPAYSLNSYNVLEVSELKNKMSDDIRILFTEYRQKRKGNFNSTTRRANDLLK